MINNIQTTSRYILVIGGNSQVPIMNGSNFGAGPVRWNPNINSFEVNDGVSWKQFIMSTANIELSEIAIETLDWARQKMEEEKELARLAETNPALKSAVEKLEEAKKQVETTKILSSK